MVVIKRVSAKAVRDSRGEKTISISINTNAGKFSASSPNGKSRSKYEANPYKKTLEQDIETIKKFSDYFSDEIIEKFEDLRRIEDVVDGHIGANTLFALESAILKAMAKKQKKEVWEIINPHAKKIPKFVGNCIGGGRHSKGKKPDFQEFLILPKTDSAKKSFELMKKIKKDLIYPLKDRDYKFENKKTDEDAWRTTLNEKEVLDILKDFNVPLGLDIAASSFHRRKKYQYSNPFLGRNSDEQILYLSNLIRNFNLKYIEDPFEENDFGSFSRLLKKFPEKLIVGDDLTATNLKRLKKAVDEKSINAIIVKPNQNGSLIKVKEVCSFAKKKGIKIIISHRSGETEEDILADIAFGFQAEFLKTGITGKERESKIKRLIEIEKSLKSSVHSS